MNGTAVVGGAGGSAVGGAIGTALMPGTGTVVGSVVGGVCGSISFGKLVNDKFEDWWRGYKITYVKDNKEILNLSLEYFGYQAKDFNDSDIINMETVTMRYKERCKVYHPDKGGTKEEWICLVNHFAVVSDALRKRDKGKNKTKTNNNNNNNNNNNTNNSLLNTAHQQEINQLKQEKEQMQQEIQRLRQELASYQNNGGGYNNNYNNNGGYNVVNQSKFYDVPLDDNTV